MRYFCLIAFLALMSTATAQNSIETTRKKDSITIAIYSSDNSFFEGYPLDSLVAHLNELNQEKHIRYFRNTEDNSKTGFKADYLVDIKLAVKSKHGQPPKFTSIPITRETLKTIRDPGGTFRTVPIREVIGYENTVTPIPDSDVEYNLSVQTFRKNPYKKLKKVNFLPVVGEENRIPLIVGLVNTIMRIPYSKD